jgi:hypothetical protein
MNQIAEIAASKQKIDEYIKTHGSINHKDYKGRTLLHQYSIEINEVPIDVLKYMIELGGDVNIKDMYGFTSIHHAFENFKIRNNEEKVQLLLFYLSQPNVDVNEPSNAGQTIFSLACNNINNIPFELFKVLVEVYNANPCGYNISTNNNNNNNNDDIKGDNHNTPTHTLDNMLNEVEITISDKKARKRAHVFSYPVHLALKSYLPRTDVNILIYLLNLPGVDVNQGNHTGETMVFSACRNVTNIPLIIFKLMIEEKGGDVTAAEDTFRETPVQEAIVRSTVGDDETQNNSADKQEEILLYLLSQNNVNVDAQSRHKHTLLRSACYNIANISINIFKYLIDQKRSDLNVLDDVGNTNIHVAIKFFKHPKDVNKLIYLFTRPGVNFHVKNAYDETVFHLACGNIGAIPVEIFKKLLFEFNSDIFNKDLFPLVPIQKALTSWNPSNGWEVMGYLLKQYGITVSDHNSILCKYGDDGGDEIKNGGFNDAKRCENCESASNTKLVELNENSTKLDKDNEKAFELCQGLRKHLIQSLEMTKYIIEERLIKTPIDGNKFLIFLAVQNKPSVEAIKYLCENTSNIMFCRSIGVKLTYLHGLLSKRHHWVFLTLGDIFQRNLEYDTEIYVLVEYLIKKCIQQILQE